MIKEILCDKPYNLLNPYTPELLIKFGVYLWKGVLYELTPSQRNELKFRFCKKHYPDGFHTTSLTLEELEGCAIIKPDGTTIPLVFQVPCGKCEVCKYNKGKEWQTRCACESMYSTTAPVFVTLTFNELSLPKDGLEKSHLQKFFKRLRKTFDMRNLENDLRYFAVGEYGDELGRPHYHLLLWNLPTELSLFKLFRLIEDAWSYECTFEEFQKLRDYERLCRYDKKYNRHTRKYELVKVYRKRIGIAQAELARDKSGAYAALYMGSDNNPCKYPNPPFYLASRGHGGLGYKWCDDNSEMYHTKLDISSVELPTETGTKHYKIPKYFINRWFPVRSKIVTKECMDMYKEFSWCASELLSYEPFINNNIYDNIISKVNDVLSKYSFLPDLIGDALDHDILSQIPNLMDINTDICIDRLFTTYSYLIDYQINTRELNNHLDREKRSELIQCNALRFESTPLKVVKDNIFRAKNERKIKSSF